MDLAAKRISLQSGEQLQSIFIIIATGVRRRALGIPGEKEFIGRGIIESAARDRESFCGHRCMRYWWRGCGSRNRAPYLRRSARL